MGAGRWSHLSTCVTPRCLSTWWEAAGTAPLMNRWGSSLEGAAVAAASCRQRRRCSMCSSRTCTHGHALRGQSCMTTASPACTPEAGSGCWQLGSAHSGRCVVDLTQRRQLPVVCTPRGSPCTPPRQPGRRACHPLLPARALRQPSHQLVGGVYLNPHQPGGHLELVAVDHGVGAVQEAAGQARPRLGAGRAALSGPPVLPLLQRSPQLLSCARLLAF